MVIIVRMYPRIRVRSIAITKISIIMIKMRKKPFLIEYLKLK